MAKTATGCTGGGFLFFDFFSVLNFEFFLCVCSGAVHWRGVFIFDFFSVLNFEFFFGVCARVRFTARRVFFFFF